MRLGIDADHLTYREAGLRAQDAGVTYVALHGRTASDFYGGQARWGPIAELADLLDIPVLGNGDIWEAEDALRMIAETGCAGVVVGRGCLGRPWLFADLAAAFTGRAERSRPDLREVTRAMRRHAELLAEWLGRGTRAARISEARRVVPEGLRGRQRDPRGVGQRVDARRTRPPVRAVWISTSHFPTTCSAGRAAGRHRPGRSRSRTVGWPTAGRVPCLRTRSCAIRAAESLVVRRAEHGLRPSGKRSRALPSTNPHRSKGESAKCRSSCTTLPKVTRT